MGFFFFYIQVKINCNKKKVYKLKLKSKNYVFFTKKISIIAKLCLSLTLGNYIKTNKLN